MELVKTADNQVGRPLHVLARLIKEDLKSAKEASEQASKPYYRAAGEKLIEAKTQSDAMGKPMPRSEFISWTKRNLNIGEVQANLYMSYARATANIENKSQDLLPSLHQHRKDLGLVQNVYPRPWHAPVKEVVDKVNVEALKQDALERQKERALQHKLAATLIDIGYKVLATKLHPDKGGSREAMARLNRVRDILRKAVSR